MASRKQMIAAQKNIQKAQKKWQSLSKTAHSRAQPEGRGRARPGTTGEGDYYRIEVRPKSEFTTFRNQDVGDPGHIQRLAGKRGSGSWSTQAWLVSKKDAHIEGQSLIADTQDAKDLLATLSSTPEHVKGDVFKAHDRKNVPESSKPTAAQKKAREENIKKAQEAR